MNKTQKALKMAIEQIKDVLHDGLWHDGLYEALKACKEALAQPAMTYEQGFAHGYEAHRVEQENDKQESIVSLWEALTDKQPAQEPVACHCGNPTFNTQSITHTKKKCDELLQVLQSCNEEKIHFDGDHFHEVLKACKEALAELQEQNPVAYIYETKVNDWTTKTLSISLETFLPPDTTVTPLYTSKSNRKWIGLSNDEIAYFECLKAPPVHPDFINDDSWYDFARAIEQALKEKNY